MNTKTKMKTSAAKSCEPKKNIKHDRDAASDEVLERYTDKAKKIGAKADKKYVEFKEKVKDAAKDVQDKAEGIRKQAVKKIDEWLE